MKSDETLIQLRGHHISVLAGYYFNKNNYREKLDSASHKIIKIVFSRMTNPKAKIKIVTGLDSICLLCSEKKDSCYELGEEDEFTLKRYKISLGEIYNSKEILNKIREYPLAYGWESPREHWETMLLERIG